MSLKCHQLNAYIFSNYTMKNNGNADKTYQINLSLKKSNMRNKINVNIWSEKIIKVSSYVNFSGYCDKILF